MRSTELDPITLEIVESSLQAISDEMFAALRKTAMSAIIYEVLDMGTGITDGEGNLVSSGAGIPTFVGVLDKAVKRIIELHVGGIEPGDIFVTNDPFYGTIPPTSFQCAMFAVQATRRPPANTGIASTTSFRCVTPP